MRKRDYNLFIGIFIIIVGLLPFIGVYTSHLINQIIDVLLIVLGIVLIIKR